MNKQKVVFAIGFRDLENYIQNSLINEIDVVGTTVYREGIIKAVEQRNPDTIVIRETLDGQIDIMGILYQLRTNYPHVRVVIIASQRHAGDSFLATLVNYGIFDIIQGNKVSALEIVDRIKNPNTYRDVAHYQPKPEFDENKNKMLFHAPDLEVAKPKEIVREIVKEVYVEPKPVVPEEQKKELKDFFEKPSSRVMDFGEEVNSIPDAYSDEDNSDCGSQGQDRTQHLQDLLNQRSLAMAKEPSGQGIFSFSSDETELSENNYDRSTRTHPAEARSNNSFDEDIAEIPIFKPEQINTVAIEPSVKTLKKPRQGVKSVPIVERGASNIVGYKESRPTQEKGVLNKLKLLATGKSASRQKIITFTGAKRGLGVTSMALNTAIALASSGSKTLFIEFEDRTPSVSYWYELSSINKGIDSALVSIDEENYPEVKNAIIYSEYIKNVDGALQNNYKKLPNNLNFLLYSHSYISRVQSETNIDNLLRGEALKELFFYILFQLEYDFIVIDIPSSQKSVFEDIAQYSNQLFFTINQDVSTIGYTASLLADLKKKNIDLENKINFIVNRYVKSNLDKKEIINWIDSKNVITFPDINKEFINANYSGVPLSLAISNSGVKSSLKEIRNMILR